MANQTETDRNRTRQASQKCMRWMHDDAEINCNLLAFSLNNKFHLSFLFLSFSHCCCCCVARTRHSAARSDSFGRLAIHYIIQKHNEKVMTEAWARRTAFRIGRAVQRRPTEDHILMKEKEAIEGMKLNHWMAGSNITGAHTLIHDQIILISIRLRWTRSKTFLYAHIRKWMHLVQKPYSYM